MLKIYKIKIGKEITTNAYIDMQQVVRETIKEIGYDNGDYGYVTCT